jgi:starvation-inducible DNA-binding protein
MTIETATAAVTPGRARVADELAKLLADTSTLYMKTQGYHWNVTGPSFASLHLLFEEQYVELREAIDEIAERIRALGHVAPGSYRQVAGITRLAEDGGAPPAIDMVRRLAGDHATVAATAREVLRSADAAQDVATVDLATRRVTVHEKAEWMLRATADGDEYPA